MAKEGKCWEFWRRMFQKGVYIILGLTNGTAATQVMDQGYTAYMPTCNKSTDRVVNMKLGARMAARKKKASKDAGDAGLLDLLQYMDDDDSDLEDDLPEEGNPDERGDPGVADSVVAKQTTTVMYKGRACNMVIGNLDFGNIINSFAGNPIETGPFDFSFQRKDILYLGGGSWDLFQ